MTESPARKSAARAKTAKPAPASRTSAKTAAGSSKPATADPADPSGVNGAAKPKHKLVRDSFTIPKAEYAVLEGLKERAANLKRPTKKSELLRAGVAALFAMTDKAFLATLNGVHSLKTGRPRKAKGGGSDPVSSPHA